MANAKIPVETLSEEEAAAELAFLAAEIARNDELYHGQDAPEISDADYDGLKRRNEAIEARFPMLVRDDSPSRRVGSAPLPTFAPITHSLAMVLAPIKPHRVMPKSSSSSGRRHSSGAPRGARS